MARSGWIKIYRKLLDDPEYLQKPFDRGHAWIDLLLSVTSVSTDVDVKGKIIHLEPGQMVMSYRHLADRWGWSMERVRRWMKMLTSTGSVTVTSTRSESLLTLVKWASYQGGEYTKQVTNEYAEQVEIKNKDLQEEKKKEQPSKCAYGEYNNVLLTDTELDRLKAAFPDTYDEWIERLSNYIASTGKVYKSHYATIRNWERMDKQRAEEKQENHNRFRNFSSERKVDYSALIERSKRARFTE